MTKFVYSVFISIAVLLQGCSGNKSHPTSNTLDSLHVRSSQPVAMDSGGLRSSGNQSSQGMADSAPVTLPSKIFGFPADSASMAHMKDSMFSMVKNKMGSNAGAVDSMMSVLGKLSTSAPTQSVSSGDTATKRSTPYHEPLSPDYVIPVTGSGIGFYYQYVGGAVFNGQKSGFDLTMSVDPSKNSGWNVFFDGYAQVQGFGIDTHISFLMDKSFTHVVLNDDHNVYTTQKADRVIQKKNYSVTDIRVTKIGDEKLHGFNCVHAKVTAVTHFMGQPQNNEYDIWRSEEIPGAAQLESSIQVLSSPFTLDIEDQLVKIGCKGAIVKIEFGERPSGIRKELFKITKQNIDPSIFNIPSGYKEDKNTSLYSLMPGN